MLSDKPFRKEDLDLYLKELAKEFRKRNGKTIPAEITLIGGASILINYGFREMTYDMDAIMDAASSIRDAITLWVIAMPAISDTFQDWQYLGAQNFCFARINFSQGVKRMGEWDKKGIT